MLWLNLFGNNFLNKILSCYDLCFYIFYLRIFPFIKSIKINFEFIKVMHGLAKSDVYYM